MSHPRTINGFAKLLAPPGRLANKGRMAETIPAWVDGRLVAVEKLEVHRRGLWHPAVSVFLMDGARTLIQRRALGKYHTPGLWANACCTHPRHGEDPAACAARRLREELGLGPVALAPLGRVAYAAPVGGGMVEREEVALFAAAIDSRLPAPPRPRRGHGHPLDHPRRAARPRSPRTPRPSPPGCASTSPATPAASSPAPPDPCPSATSPASSPASPPASTPRLGSSSPIPRPCPPASPRS